MSSNLARCTFTLESFPEVDTLRYSTFFSPPSNPQVSFELFLNPHHSVPLCDRTYVLVFLYLHKCNLDELPVHYRLSILNSSGERSHRQEGEVRYDFKGNSRYNGLYHVARAELLEPANGLLTNGTLKIDCEVEILSDLSLSSAPSSSTGAPLKPGDSLLADFASLLVAPQFSDLTLIIDETKTLSVHKAILAARSPVFAELFTANPPETSLQMDDITFEVLQELLRYLYTGRLTCLDQYAVELLQAATKYQIEALKSLCEHSLAANLSTDSVASILALADEHQATHLKDKCMEYIIDMAEIVMLTEGWKQLTLNAKPELAFELFSCVIGKLHK